MPPCSGRGRIVSPSSSSLDLAAEAGQLGGQRGEPVGLVPAQVADAGQRRRGVGQRGERREHGGVSSPTSRRSASMPVIAPVAGHGQPAPSTARRRAHRASSARSSSPAWVVAAGQLGTVTGRR